MQAENVDLIELKQIPNLQRRKEMIYDNLFTVRFDVCEEVI